MVFADTPVTLLVILVSSASAAVFKGVARSCTASIFAARTAARRNAAASVCLPSWMIDSSNNVSSEGGFFVVRYLIAPVYHCLHMLVASAPFLSMPFGPIALNWTDGFTVLLIFFYVRELERRWGRGRFLSFFLTMSFMGSLYTMAVFHLSSTAVPLDPMPIRLFQIISCLGSLVPLSALVTRFKASVKSGSSRSNGKTTQSFVVWLALLKLVFFPSTTGLSGVQYTSGVRLLFRIGALGVGSLLGSLSMPPEIAVEFSDAKSRRREMQRNGSLLYRWILWLSRNFCRPLCRSLQPFFSLLGSPEVVVVHHRPRKSSSSHEGAREHPRGATTEFRGGPSPGRGGRLYVDQLSNSSQYNQVNSFSAGGSAANNRRCLDLLHQHLQDMGILDSLGSAMSSEEELRAVLEASDWNIERAVELILSRM